MEIKDFTIKFADQFEDTDASLITPDTEFRKLEEWSSLTALSVIAMIDEEYGISLKGDDMKTSVTVQDLFEKVKSKL